MATMSTMMPAMREFRDQPLGHVLVEAVEADTIAHPRHRTMNDRILGLSIRARMIGIAFGKIAARVALVIVACYLGMWVVRYCAPRAFHRSERDAVWDLMFHKSPT